MSGVHEFFFNYINENFYYIIDINLILTERSQKAFSNLVENAKNVTHEKVRMNRLFECSSTKAVLSNLEIFIHRIKITRVHVIVLYFELHK